MPLRRGTQITFTPRTLSDAVDGTPVARGAMASLSNLIPDTATQNVFVPRPAAVAASTFVGFTGPLTVSALLVVGDVAYGMIGSGLNANKDEPFAYNLAAGAFLTVFGITAGNTPVSPATTGAWTPPIMAQVGSRILVCHPGFAGGATKFGWFDLSGTALIVTGNTAIGSPTIASVSSTVAIQPGLVLSGTGIPAGAVVVSTTATTIIMSANATAANVGVTITVYGGTTSGPLWGAGDTDRNALPSVPVAVAQFNGRAYFACGADGMPYSDSGFPCRISDATAVQALTTGDGLAITALGPLGVTAPLTGGIVQGLVAFAGVSRMYQILGDQALGNLSINALQASPGAGTAAPLSIVATEEGLAYISPQGLRRIDFNGRVSPVIGHNGAGVSVPFIQALTPSRICGAANADTLRYSVQRGDVAGNPWQEFWLDLSSGLWTGPHTFPASCIEAWQATFLMAAIGVPAALWTSDSTPTLTSVYTEGGTALMWAYQPSLLPDTGAGAMNALVEMTLAIAAGSGQSLTLQATDSDGTPLDRITIDFAAAPQWDSAVWDRDRWDGGGTYTQIAVNWTVPLVFRQLNLTITGKSLTALRIGNLYMQYQILGYKLQATG